MKPIIKAKKINFTYNKGKSNEYKALIDIDLDVYPHEFVIIFGPSGCGKSSLLNVVAGLELPDDGSLEVMGRDLFKLSKGDFSMYHRKDVGMIYQSYNLITSLSVLDNVALPQIFINSRKKKRDKLSMSLLKRFGIDKQAKKLPTELSGGQQQRIGIARSIVNDPDIILADEPVGNLDSNSAQNVLEILRELNEKEEKTVIMVTHNPEYLDYGDRIIYMKDGLIVREVNNKDKKFNNKKRKGVVPKTPTEHINSLMRSYQGLSPNQINILILPYKAKMFANFFISKRNIEETTVLENVIQRRIMGLISKEELYEILHKPSNEGGVGFDKRTAENIIKKINRTIRMAYFIGRKHRQRKDSEGNFIEITIEEKVEKITTYLLKTCYLDSYKNLKEEQLERLKTAVRERVENIVNKSDFYNYLDLSFSEKGVGLNSKTARSISDELELLLVLGYGILKGSIEKKPEEAKDVNPDKNVNFPEISESGAPDLMASVRERFDKINKAK